VDVPFVISVGALVAHVVASKMTFDKEWPDFPRLARSTILVKDPKAIGCTPAFRRPFAFAFVLKK
jgi:hypothetical protein